MENEFVLKRRSKRDSPDDSSATSLTPVKVETNMQFSAPAPASPKSNAEQRRRQRSGLSKDATCLEAKVDGEVKVPALKMEGDKLRWSFVVGELELLELLIWLQDEINAQ